MKKCDMRTWTGGSVVGIATRYGLDSSGIESLGGQDQVEVSMTGRLLFSRSPMRVVCPSMISKSRQWCLGHLVLLSHENKR